MGVPRAQWFIDVDPDGPAVGEQSSIEQVGKPIRLDREPALNARLIELVALEEALHQRGIRCPIKERSDTTCFACPLAAERTSEPLYPLCQLGRAQERVMTELAVVRVNGAEASS